jgi:predicted transcriptional regulator
MSKIYQPIVIKKTEEIIKTLIESKLFEDYDIKTTEYATKYFLDKLTEKFILGEIDLDYDMLFTEDEFDRCIRDVILGSIFTKLKENGYVNSYEDDDTDETFFLTEKGKEYLKMLRENDKN